MLKKNVVGQILGLENERKIRGCSLSYPGYYRWPKMGVGDTIHESGFLSLPQKILSFVFINFPID